MRKFVHLQLHILSAAAILTQVFVPAQRVAAQPAIQTGGCREGAQASGALYQACLPETGWNGDLVLYAHGYVPPDAPLALPAEAGAISSALRAQGYAFATTSYRVNGLAVQPAQADLLDLAQVFSAAFSAPRRVFLIGASEGGLITTLSVERHPDIYAGGLEMCGPTGSFRDQVNYFGDFRVVFDALFPGVLASDPVHIPKDLIHNWYSAYQERLLPLVQDPANREKLIQLLQVTGAAYNPQDPQTVLQTLRGVLGYNIFATNDAAEKLGGQPFDNRERVYTGSANDARLNQAVRRIQADPAALDALQAYQATGELRVPLVALHTTGDEIVPFFHLERYGALTQKAGREGLYLPVPIQRYGHCNFTSQEILSAFNRLVEMADHSAPAFTATPNVQVTRTSAAANPTLDTALATAPTPRPESPQPRSPLAGIWERFVQFIQGLVK